MQSLALFHVSPVNFVLTLVVFGTVLVILTAKAWKPILKALEERDEKIRGDLDRAEASRKEAERLVAEQQKAMQSLREEGKKIREEAVAMANKHRSELVEAAKKESEQLVAKARVDINNERLAAIDDIKKLAVEVGVDLARKLIRKEISESAHRDVIAASLNEIEKAYRKTG